MEEKNPDFNDPKLKQMVDHIKLGIAVSLIALGIAGFYLLNQTAMALRIGVVIGSVVLAVIVAWFTEPGRKFIEFSKEAVVETKKVVWPTRKETLQTTGLVIAFVVVMAVFLWLTDKSLEWILYDWILGWKKT